MHDQSGPDCRHFGQHIKTDIVCGNRIRVFECHHPDIKGVPPQTAEGLCKICKLHQPIQFPEFQLASAITTSPRAAGIDKEYLKATHVSCIQARMNVLHISRDEDRILGPFGNLYRAATEIYLMDSHASAYGLIQDDVELDCNAASRVGDLMVSELQSVGRPVMVASLYLPDCFEEVCTDLGLEHDGTDNWFKIDRGWNTPGACAFVFSDLGIRSFLTDQVVLAHRRIGPNNGWRDSDAVVGVWASQFGGIWYPRKTLAKHFGEVSTIARDDES